MLLFWQIVSYGKAGCLGVGRYCSALHCILLFRLFFATYIIHLRTGCSALTTTCCAMLW